MPMNIDSPRSRRSLLAGAIGGIAAGLAGMAARAERVVAGAGNEDGDTVAVGGEYFHEHTPLVFWNQANDNTVFQASSTHGGTGVFASSVSSEGVHAESQSGRGLSAKSNSGIGIHTESTTNTALYAVGYQDPSIHAVNGSSGMAILAEAESGIGVWAASSSGIGLRVSGSVALDRAGRITIPVGKGNGAIQLPYKMAPESNILCFLESNQAGLRVERVVKLSSLYGFKVFLNTTLTTGKYARVGYVVLG